MDSTLARLRALASLFLVLSVVAGVGGLAAVGPDANLSGDTIFWIPAAVGILGLFGVNYGADPLLLRGRSATPRELPGAVSAMTRARLAAAATPTAAGLLVGAVATSAPAVVLGCGASVVMATHWWPGSRSVHIARVKLSQTSGAQTSRALAGPGGGRA